MIAPPPLVLIIINYNISSIILKTAKKTLIENDQSLFGPSAEIRTRGLLNPIQARYQLRYTRILDAVKKCLSHSALLLYALILHLSITIFGKLKVS